MNNIKPNQEYHPQREQQQQQHDLPNGSTTRAASSSVTTAPAVAMDDPSDNADKRLLQQQQKLPSLSLSLPATQVSNYNHNLNHNRKRSLDEVYTKNCSAGINHDNNNVHDNPDHCSMIIFSSTLCNTILPQQRLAPVSIGISQISSSKNNNNTSTSKLSNNMLQFKEDDTKQSTTLSKLLRGTFDDDADVDDNNYNGNIEHDNEVMAAMTTTATTVSEGGKDFDSTTSNDQTRPIAMNGIVYKVFNSDGTERRMTAQEKKQAKFKHKLHLKEQQQQQQQQVKDKDKHNSHTRNMDRNSNLQSHHDTTNDSKQQQPQPPQDLPPVMLSSAMAQILMQSMDRRNSQRNDSKVKFDIDLSDQWAKSIYDSMMYDVQLRQQESNIRIMPYHVIPTVWERIRPNFFDYNGNNNVVDTIQSNDILQYQHISQKQHYSDPHAGSNDNTNCDWLLCNINPQPSHRSTNIVLPIDDDTTNHDHYTILQFLHSSTDIIHISCGAKFGCDYLLYDGPRHERHAFAGLRIISSLKQNHHNNMNGANDNNKNYNFELAHNFPHPPNPYDLYGYVRCLNTAGKLALLATTIVVPNDDVDATIHTAMDNDHQQQLWKKKVLIVDLVLEKVAITTSRRPKKTMDQRLKNLSKKSV